MALTLGANIQLGSDWVANITTHYSKTNDFNSQPEIDLVNAQTLANAPLSSESNELEEGTPSRLRSLAPSCADCS